MARLGSLLRHALRRDERVDDLHNSHCLEAGLRESAKLFEADPIEAEGTDAPTEAEAELQTFLTDISTNNNRPRALGAILGEVADRVRSLTDAEGVLIALADPWGVVCRASSGAGPVVGSRLTPDSALTKACFEGGQVLLCEDAANDPRVESMIAKRLQLRSLVAVPIVSEGSVLGVVEALSSTPFAFDQTHVARLLRVAFLLAPVVAPPPVQPEERPQRPWHIYGMAAAATIGILAVFWVAKSSHKPLRTPPQIAGLPSRVPERSQPQNQKNSAGVFSHSRVEQPATQPSVISGEANGNGSPLSRLTAREKRRAAIPLTAAEVSGPAVAPSSPNPSSPEGLETAQTSQLAAKLEPPALPAEPAKALDFSVVPTLPLLVRSRVASPDFVLDRTVKGHASWVTGLAFSADGQRLASGSWDQTVKFWDVLSGQPLRTVASKMEVQALAFSRDGRWLAAENSRNTVTLWDAVTGQEVRTLASNKPLGILGSNWVYSIAFSPDGRWLASSVDDKTVRLWDVATGRVVRDLATLRRSVMYVAFSPDGTLLASGDDDKSIRIWSVSTGEEVSRLSGHKRPIYAVAFSPNGRWLASASADKTVKIWDVKTGSEVHTLRGHEGPITSLAFSPDGHWLASGSWDKTVKIWDVERGQESQTLAGEKHSIYSVAFDSRGRWLASGSEDGSINFWRSRH